MRRPFALLVATVLAAALPLAGGPAASAAEPVTSDFNGDGFSDLAIGIPGEGGADRGAVAVLYGDGAGLNHFFNQLWSQASPGLRGSPQEADRFGASVAAGDVNGDGNWDLVVGVPGDRSSAGAVGAIQVLYGSNNGLQPAGNQLISGPFAAGSAFGQAVATGDFNRDGFADVAVGAPRRDAGRGAVQVFDGSAGGLVVPGRVFGQGTLAGDPERADRFGSALAAGDFDLNGVDDLAVGVPGEDSGEGAVNVVYASLAGLRVAGNQEWKQDRAGVAGAGKAGDRFGAALAAGDFGRGFQSDLAIGVPGDDVAGPDGSGGVNVLYGVAGGLTSAGSQLLSRANLRGAPVAGAGLGSALVATTFGRGGFADLAIGAPGDTVAGVAEAGSVNVVYGSSSGLAPASDQLWSRATPDVQGDPQAGAHLGAAVFGANFGQAFSSDLAMAAPGQDDGAAVDAGDLNVLYSGERGLGTPVNQIWRQDTTQIQDDPEAGDEFGFALA